MIEIVSQPPQRDSHMTFLGSEPSQKRNFLKFEEMHSAKISKPSLFGWLQYRFKNGRFD